ncbi:hypothetical protein RB195_012082 [Necator americanus]|uniref:DNA-directed RNA polymerase subunit n=1 Tax=Necator americanus TaxID=51031 RepID=A0ABR1D718_NECAM
MVKEQYREVDTTTHKVVGVEFLPADRHFVRRAAHIRVCKSRLYEENPERRIPTPFGPLDHRLGISSKYSRCQTCEENLSDCVGHFGYIDLSLPVFHVGFFKLILQVLQCICKSCSSLLLNDTQRSYFLEQISVRSLDYSRRKALQKKLVLTCSKTVLCPKCGRYSGIVKKAKGTVLKIVHTIHKIENETSSYETAIQANPDLFAALQKNKSVLLNPLRVLKLFNNIPEKDLRLIMVQRNSCLIHPNSLLLVRIPVPPVCIRPSIVSDFKSGTTEDDLTMKLSEIILINDILQTHKKNGAPLRTVMEAWDHLQLQIALYFNGELSGLPSGLQPREPLRGLMQRLKGKHGRFRCHLSGKRVDFTARTVISPDPNMHIDEIGVPIHIALTLTFPEIVNDMNLERMKQLVLAGPNVHPGANYVLESSTGRRYMLKYVNRDVTAAKLKIGDIVERHLDDGDVVLFNRTRMRFNECVCTPYNADFDGDEMNVHVPQTHEARAEAYSLMNVKNNMVTPRSGEILIAAIQDFITGTYLLTHKDTFLNYQEICRLTASLIDDRKQLAELVFSDDLREFTLTAPNRSYTSNKEFCVKDSFVIIRNGRLISGVLDKALVGPGSKTSIFHAILRDFGGDAAADAMWRLSRITTEYLTNHGFSIGISDVCPSTRLLKEKASLINDGYKKCRHYIEQLKMGNLNAQPGFSDEETFEALVLHELSSIRDKAGKSCIESLSKYNSALLMAICGSKGSLVNISQMIACVGQQAVSGHRTPDGFDKRSLPHFEKSSKTPEARGFIENSFFTGLTPTEFFFHTISGREGLVDTAVKTAETGYMQRRLVKCLEDLCVSYDGTVRSSTGEIVQLVFGEDGLDPASIETENVALLDFRRELEHVRSNIPFLENEEVDWNSVQTLAIDVTEEIRKIHPLFRDQLLRFTNDVIDANIRYRRIPKFCCKHRDRPPPNIIDRCTDCLNRQKFRNVQIQTHCVSKLQLMTFLEKCCLKLKRAIIEPGTAVGAIAATSIGEPTTQMTLKTFHFAGVASMNITQGIPRIKEIIDAVKSVSTPIISAKLVEKNNEGIAREVKARIDVTTLGEICDYIEEIYLPNSIFLLLKLSRKRMKLLRLQITLSNIVQSILTSKYFTPFKTSQITTLGKSMMVIKPPSDPNFSPTISAQIMKQALQKVAIKGVLNVKRCAIHADERHGNEYEIVVEGSNFRDVLSQPGIDYRFTYCNNASTVSEVLGIEAARAVIITEIITTMNAHGINLDRRHVMLLADLMTFRGEVLGMTRNGLMKMKESVLGSASFEKTCEHLYEAAFFSQRDTIRGVSERIILGVPISLGTGMFDLLQYVPDIATSVGCEPKTPIFLKSKFGAPFSKSGDLCSKEQAFCSGINQAANSERLKSDELDGQTSSSRNPEDLSHTAPVSVLAPNFS